MKITFQKYEGAGNDFIMIDNRTNYFPKSNKNLIKKLCNRRFGIGADGLILIENSKNYHFTMTYYNSDGSESTMCGNGGRCIVAFAKKLGIIKNEATFQAIDGLHNATIKNEIINLQMIDVTNIEEFKTHTFLNTGSPHHVTFTDNVSTVNVKSLGEKISHSAPYFKEGSNVNFVEQISEDTFKVRTYERGVEDETLACGTGVTAVALAARNLNKTTSNSVKLQVEGGNLEVSFIKEGNTFKNVILSGPATFVYEGIINVK